MRKFIAVALSCLTLAGCASRASDIKASYVSTTGYDSLSCSQLANEAQAVSAHVISATGEQNNRATGDAVAMTVGMVVFWPALFLMHGDGATAGELARLKGEMEAIETTSRRKGCNIHFETREAQKAGNQQHRSGS